MNTIRQSMEEGGIELTPNKEAPPTSVRSSFEYAYNYALLWHL